MNNLYFELLERSENLCFDAAKKEKLNHNLRNWNENHGESVMQFSDLRLAKDKFTSTREKSLYNLDNIVFEFERNFIERGGKVAYAVNNKDVCDVILKILKSKNAENVVINSNPLLEDIGIKDFLRKKNTFVDELNIDNIMREQDDECIFNEHLTLTSSSYDAEDMQKMLSKKYETNAEITVEELIERVKNDNNEKLRKSEALISGVNIMVADSGSVVLIDNEGAMAKAQAYSSTKIFIATIDQIMSNIADLDLYLTMYSSYTYGKRIASNCMIISGASSYSKENNNADVHVIIVNSSRVSMLGDSSVRSIMRCINCGACLNVCPIYKCGSGRLYSNPYPGPLGTVLVPLTKSMSSYNFLPYLCTLCGRCSNICPVKIDIPSLILHLRHTIVTDDLCTGDDEKLVQTLHKRFTKRKKLDRRGAWYKNRKLRRLTVPWCDWAELPKFAKKSFASQYVTMVEKERKEQDAAEKAKK